MTKQEYNYKGNPAEIRGVMAKEVKDDLRASHFRVGFDQSAPFTNTKSTSGRPISAAPY